MSNGEKRCTARVRREDEICASCEKKLDEELKQRYAVMQAAEKEAQKR
jgi:hypothetical protein